MERGGRYGYIRDFIFNDTVWDVDNSNPEI
jgi:hypothetical protein